MVTEFKLPCLNSKAIADPWTWFNFTTTSPRRRKVFKANRKIYLCNNLCKTFIIWSNAYNSFTKTMSVVCTQVSFLWAN